MSLSSSQSTDLQALISMLSSGSYRNVIVMNGAGVSVAAGIPDFRSPSTGLYSSLTRMALRRCRSPSFVFDYSQFLEDPRPFWWLFSRLWPRESVKPTIYHFFATLLHRHGLLLRCYTQNIDGLEELGGLPAEMVVCAHGSLDRCHCQDCQREIPLEYCLTEIAENDPTDVDYSETIVPFCPECKGAFVKPDVVFFGEELPKRFYELVREDLPKCDLLIIAGTSLAVYPFAGIADAVPRDVPRVVLNRENVLSRGGLCERIWGIVRWLIGVKETGHTRDYFVGGDIQEAATAIAAGLGWEQELAELLPQR
jgi:NAD-dependent SIR2 family protein deacetylase